MIKNLQFLLAKPLPVSPLLASAAFLIFFIMLPAFAQKAKGEGRSEYQVADFSCTLSSEYKVSKTQYTISDYSSSHFLLHSLRVPDLQEIADVPKTGGTTNALVIECPGGGYAVVFSMEGALPSPQEQQQRIEDLRKDYAQKYTLPYAEAFTLVTGGPAMIDALPAHELILRMPLGEKDTLSTLITTAQFGGRSYGVLLRSKESLQYKAPSAARLSYLNILNSIDIPALYNERNTYADRDGGYSITMPTAWATAITKRQLYDPFPTKENLDAKKNIPALSKAGSIIKDDTTFWNALVVQLPIVQIEIIVAPSHPRIASALKEDMQHFLKLSGTNPNAANLNIKNDVPFGGRLGNEFNYTLSRRDDLTHYKLIVVYANSRKYILRTSAWERDMPAVEKMLSVLLKGFKIV